MRSRSLLPALPLLLGLALLPWADRMTRLPRASARTASAETTWVRYVMVGLGGFRGVIAEILWIRADRLQQQGRYMELMQLSDWITALDPRATEGWSFNAWNLAYNIPAMLPDPEARLPWVRAGISLLRDKALPANPASPRLYRELGWLYQNKIGSDADQAHLAYKLDLASEYAEDGRRARPSAPGAVDTLDPLLVARIEGRFGKIDWRLANAHALYWACKGLELEPTGFERDSLRRMVQQTLVAMVFAGRFTGDLEAGRYETAPAYGLVPGLELFFEESIRSNDGEKKIYSIFLARLVQTFAKAGLPEKAHAAYGKLRALAEGEGAAPPSFDEIAAGARQGAPRP